MANLIYSAITSLDGYVADEDGDFDWAEPDEEVHAFVNDLEREVGTYLYGRRMYEVMVAWETMSVVDEPPVIRDYAEIWRAADKVVVSTTLETASSARTRIERDFDPEAIRQMKASVDRDISVGGPGLAAHALKAGAGRRVPPVRHPGRRGRRHTLLPGRAPPAAGAGRRAPLPQRRGAPSLPPAGVRNGPSRPVGALALGRLSC